MSQKMWIRWGLVEVVVVALVVSCGQVSEAPDGGDTDAGDTDDTAVGGHSMSTGGSGNGGNLMIVGDVPLGGAPSEWCPHIPVGIVDPPCTEDDLVIGGGCVSDEWLRFEFPIADLDLSYPSGPLTLSLVPAPKLGPEQEGDAAVMTRQALDVWLYPDDGGVVTGASFVINAPRTALFSQIGPEDPTMAAYVTRVLVPGLTYDSYFHITHIALTDGDTLLSERRVVFNPPQGCWVK